MARVLCHVGDGDGGRGDAARGPLRRLGNGRGRAAEAGGETTTPLPNTDEADQPVVGLLAAALGQLFERGHDPALADDPAAAAGLASGIGSVAFALTAVTKARWLLVEARRDHLRRGLRTTVERIEAADVDEAREHIAAEIARRRQLREVGDGLVESMINAVPRRPAR